MRTEAPSLQLGLAGRAGLALLCVGAPIAALAARWMPDQTLQVAFGAVVCGALLALALMWGRMGAHQILREVAWTLFAFALVQLLNNTIPGFTVRYVLGETPSGANPLASSVAGSVVVQLLDTAIAIVPILLMARLARLELASLYLRRASAGWLAASVAVFVAVYVFLLTIPLRPGSPLQQILPAGAGLTVERILALTPALVIMALSNGFQEELLFRGLFLNRFTILFGAVVANLLQSLVFTAAHLGVGYTPELLVFLVVLVFPLGLLGGYLMRAANSVLVPAVVHGALDMVIYLGFLAAVSH
jgi:membrane protease YdiL (CAAX protease family)